VTQLQKQVAAVSKQRFMIGGKVYKYGDLNETDGTFYAATHLHRDVEAGFFCPTRLYGGTAPKIKAGTTYQVADGEKCSVHAVFATSLIYGSTDPLAETIVADPLGAQACCLLDKVSGDVGQFERQGFC
jgi:hypothetical protein